MNPEERGDNPRLIEATASNDKEASNSNLTVPVISSTTAESYDLPKIITAEFGQLTWEATEACLATHASLLIDDISPLGLVLVGPQSSGKSTVLRFFDGLDEQIYATDDITPAAFLSHDASQDEEELEDQDLLPKLVGKTLLSPDLGTWFSGSYEEIHDRMTTVARLMDGDGFSRSTGAHGTRRYEGDTRFTILAGSTPLKGRAWRAMGNAGSRLVFHTMAVDKSDEELRDDLYGESEYDQRVQTCRHFVSDFLESLWQEYGGYGGVSWSSRPGTPTEEQLDYFRDLVRHARAPIPDGAPRPEGEHRIGRYLYNLARGRALINGRLTVKQSDLSVVARVALSSMHAKRRGPVRLLVDTATDDTLSTSQIAETLGLDKETAKTRMELLDTLGLGEFSEGSGPKPHTIRLREEFRWPASISFPETCRQV